MQEKNVGKEGDHSGECRHEECIDCGSESGVKAGQDKGSYRHWLLKKPQCCVSAVRSAAASTDNDLVNLPESSRG